MKEIIRPNVEGTKNVLEVAVEQGVKRIVYVSSIAALGHSVIPMDETTWNSDSSFPYTQSKIESEKLAWNLAEKLDLWLVAVLPSSMVGLNCFGHLTPTMNLLNMIVKGQLPIDVNFHFNMLMLEM
ncbi:MAG: NAD-dependent epimerase/dehydratase family protein [Candidatus Methanofastidiosia archaeon]